MANVEGGNISVCNGNGLFFNFRPSYKVLKNVPEWLQASYICFTVEDTIQDDLGGLKMNIIGYEDVILSNHKNRFDMTAHPIIIANRHVVLKL